MAAGMLRDLIEKLVAWHDDIGQVAQAGRQLYRADRDVPEERQVHRAVSVMAHEWANVAASAIEGLIKAFKAAKPESVIEFANSFRRQGKIVGVRLVMEALARTMGIQHPVMSFQYATVGGGTIADLINYAGKKNWGDITDLMEDPESEEVRAGEPRLWLFVHDDNPYRVVQATRNELRWALDGYLGGTGGRRLVQRSYRDTKRDFEASLTQAELTALGNLGFDVVNDFRKATKKGDQFLAGALALARMGGTGRDKKAEKGQITGFPYIEASARRSGQ